MTTKQYWKMLDTDYPPEVEKLVELINWSFNCDYPTPFHLYQNLTGFAEEYYGQQFIIRSMPRTGYKELSLLGLALDEYSNRPQDVFDWLVKLMAEEEGSDSFSEQMDEGLSNYYDEVLESAGVAVMKEFAKEGKE